MTVALNAAEFSTNGTGNKKEILTSVNELRQDIAAEHTPHVEKPPTEIVPDGDFTQGANFTPSEQTPLEEPYFVGPGRSHHNDPGSHEEKRHREEKLDYMIHLLESQRDVRTGSATEDLILYGFLGVFIIFVLDNFSRSAKYRR